MSGLRCPIEKVKEKGSASHVSTLFAIANAKKEGYPFKRHTEVWVALPVEKAKEFSFHVFTL